MVCLSCIPQILLGLFLNTLSHIMGCYWYVVVKKKIQKKKSCYNLSLYHWNFKSITAHNFSKLTLLEAHNMNHNFDNICLSQTYLYSSIQHVNKRLHLNGYQLVRAHNPNNNKSDGFSIYFKEFLAPRQVELNDLNECILFEVCI